MGAVMLAFEILGPLVVWGDDGEISISGARRRALVLRLLVTANELVPAGPLAEDLWEGDPPAGAAATLQSHISQLRKSLGPGRLHGRHGGYVLEVGPDELDLWCFEDESRRGREALGAGDPETAAGLLSSALGRWRGQALADVSGTAWARPEQTRLEEMHLGAIETWLEARLALGQHHEVVASAEAAVVDYPLREGIWGYLMLGLYRSGRQSEALRAFQRLRTVLDEELGLVPGLEVTAIERAIAVHDPALNVPPQATVPAGPTSSTGNRPTGVVTLMATDIEGSTKKWESQSSAMSVALARHDRLLHAAIEEASGYVFKTLGDGTLSVFAEPMAAVMAAASVHRLLAEENWPDDLELKVRIALHTGSCEQRDGDYLGPTVNRVSRLMAIAHGGQVLLSEVTAELVHDSLEPDIALRDLGDHRLKDLTRPEHVFQLVAPGLLSDFPPLRSATNPRLRHNIPERLSSFVGRTREVDDIRQLLRDHRLVTLTGPGGVGKTRLSLQIAAELVDGPGDGVWLVELASVSDPVQVVASVATAMSIREEQGRRVADTLVEVIGDRALLIVLDNCEHLIQACADMVSHLLDSCPAVKVLATSREQLRISGESVFRVPSLSVPPTESGFLKAIDVVRSEAVNLFVERAAAQRPGYVLDDSNAANVASVCRRLDGIPLAIELAAARMRSLSVAEIDTRLDDHLRLLTRGNRAVPRQQTLRALIDWSYQLLDEVEKIVFRRLAVFAGGFDLEAAEAVCAGVEVPAAEVTDLIGSLVDKSLVQADPVGETTRYWLLETIRQYATEHLAALGKVEDASTRARHATYYLGRAEEAAPLLHTGEQERWLDAIEDDVDNFDGAMVYFSTEPQASDQALRMGIALEWFWRYRCHYSHGAAQLEGALEASIDQQPEVLRASALAGAGWLHALCGQMDEAVAQAEAGLTLADHLGELGLVARLLTSKSYVRYQQGDYDEAVTTAEQAVGCARQSEVAQILDEALEQCGMNRMASSRENDLAQGREELEEALTHRESTGNGLRAAMCHNTLGVLETTAGNLGLAKAHFASAMQQWEVGDGRSDYEQNVALVNFNLVLVALLQEDPSGALDSLRRCVTFILPDDDLVAYQVLAGALCATAVEDFGRAAVLHGAADAFLARLGESWEPLESRLRERDQMRLRAVLGPEEFVASYESGQELGKSEAVTLAVNEESPVNGR